MFARRLAIPVFCMALAASLAQGRTFAQYGNPRFSAPPPQPMIDSAADPFGTPSPDSPPPSLEPPASKYLRSQPDASEIAPGAAGGARLNSPDNPPPGGTDYPPRRYQPPTYSPAPVYPPPPVAPLIIAPEPPRFWIRSEYLLWWTKSAPVPPLITVGSASDPVPGALGEPGTAVIYGGGEVSLPAASGWRLDLGGWIDAEARWGIGGTFFILGRQSTGFSAFSDVNGDPLLARPTIDAQSRSEFAYVDSVPGNLAGGAIVDNRSQFLGWDLNGYARLYQTDRLRIEGILGFRYLNLTESLEVTDQLQPLVPNYLTFLGQPVDPSNVMVDYDRFKTTNNFYGGQLGARMKWFAGRWSLEAITKVALGATQEKTSISGQTAVYAPSGAASVAPGGILATTANIGTYYRSPFAVSPEVDLNLGFEITPRLTARIGYSFIYLSNVLRPGDQITRVVSPALVPSDVNFGTGGPNLPGNQFHSSTFWAQGLNIGLDFHF